MKPNKIYILIPLLSKNNRPDQPYIVLSQQILVANNSNAMLIAKYLEDKINETKDLYGINDPDNLNLIFKFKEINIEFNEHIKF